MTKVGSTSTPPLPTKKPEPTISTPKPTPNPKPKPTDGFGATPATKPAVTAERSLQRTVPGSGDGTTTLSAAAKPRERKPAVATETHVESPKAGNAPPADPKFQALTEKLAGTTTAEGRQAAANELADWTRNNIVDKDKLGSYLARTDISTEEKNKTLGQLALEINRSEMVLGRSHIGGEGDWEHKGENQGDFVNYYQGHAKNAKTDAWCTKFATHPFQRLGMDLDDATGGKTSPFLSGYRLDKWANEGKSSDGKRLVSASEAVASDKTDGSVVTGGDFRDLTKSVKGAEPEARLQAVNDFMKEHGLPQPGDVIVRDKNNNVNGASHTLMVDRYDPKTGTLYTIEGNADNRVQGFSYDLKDPKVAANLGVLVRMGADMFDAKPAAAGQPQVSANDLLSHARNINAGLVKVASDKGWIHSSDPNATAAMLSSGGLNAWHPDNKTGTR